MLCLFLFFLFSRQAIATVVAGFSVSDSSGCKPLTVKFTDQSSGSPASWLWDFGNGNTSVLQHPSAIYFNAGTYTVTLTVSDGITVDSVQRIISVFNNPVAGFTVNAPSYCAGKNVQFTDASIPAGSTVNVWKWDFGDGNAATTPTGIASHNYTSSGVFPVSLIVTDLNGCSGNVVVSLTINPIPVVSFTANPTFQCLPPFPVSFTNTSLTSGIPSYSWDFGDGSTSSLPHPSHTYTLSGSYNIKLTVQQAGCIDSLTRNAFIIIGKNKSNFSASDTLVCLGKPVSFTDLSNPASASRLWDFGNGETSGAINPLYTYTSSGVYAVTLFSTDVNGCADTTRKNGYITVVNPPVAGFSASSLVSCRAPFTVNFTDSSKNPVSWKWDFGDGSSSAVQNPSHTYSQPGTYTVTLIEGNLTGCKDTLTGPSPVIISPPLAGFWAYPRNGCVPVTVLFTDTSKSVLDPIVTYVWDFGNGSAITTANPSAISSYTLTGTYPVKLKIITATGCTDSILKNPYIQSGTKPIAGYSVNPTSICYGKTVQFFDTSKNANNWKWLYGDGGSDSSIANPVHLYADTGNFSITLIAFHNGCPDTVIKNQIITVLPPKPSFIYQLSCTDYYKVNFTNTSAGADSVVWNFGDGTIDSSNTDSLSHTYATRGWKNVIITAYNKTSGCSFSQSESFMIAEPVAGFSNQPNPSYGCVPLNVIFTDSSQDASRYYWDLGNGTTTSNDTALGTYTAKGLYTVSLVISDTNGCTDTLKMNNHVKAMSIDLSNYTAVPRSGCPSLAVSFSDSSVSDSALVKWIWNWGDGEKDTLLSPAAVHSYTTRGVYSPTLTVLDKNGCRDSVVKVNYITVTKPYPVLLLDTFRCRNDSIFFNASGTTLSGPATYSWDFGDGTSLISSASAIRHAYTKDSLYTVVLKVIDVNGCDSTISAGIRILQPTASFKDSSISYGCGTKQVQFIDQSRDFIASWHWDFGNGGSSLLQHPFYTYTRPGTYYVRLIVQNIAGCSDTLASGSPVVVPGPSASFSFSPVSGCVPLKVNFHVWGNSISYQSWDFGDGTIISPYMQPLIQHEYTYPITANPVVLVGDTLPNGQLCELPAANLSGSITTYKTMNTVILPAGPLVLSEDSAILLNTAVSGAGSTKLAYSWTPSAGLSCTDCRDPVLTGTGDSLWYKLTVTDVGSGGCMDEDSIGVVFVPCETSVLTPNVFTPNNDGKNDHFKINGICTKNDFQMAIYNRWGTELFSTFQRHNGWDGTTSTGSDVPDGIYYYIVTVDDAVYNGFFHLIR